MTCVEERVLVDIILTLKMENKTKLINPNISRYRMHKTFSLNKLPFWGLEPQTTNLSERCLLELEEVDLRAVFKKLSPRTSGAPVVGS